MINTYNIWSAASRRPLVLSIAPIESTHKAHREKAHRKLNWANFCAISINGRAKEYAVERYRARASKRRDGQAGDGGAEGSASKEKAPLPSHTYLTRTAN